MIRSEDIEIKVPLTYSQKHFLYQRKRDIECLFHIKVCEKEEHFGDQTSVRSDVVVIGQDRKKCKAAKEYIVHLTTEPSKTEVFTYPNHLQIIFGNYVWMVSLQQGYSVHITCGKENYSLCVAGPAKAVSNVCSLMQSACDNAIKADIHHLERFSVSKNKELDTQLISAVRNLFRISIDIKRYKYFPDRLKEILLSWVTQAFKVSNNSQTCQDLLSSSANSSSSFNKKDDSVVIIEDTEKYGHSKNISVVEIESDDSVSDVQECCAQSSQPIKNTAKKTLSAYTSEKGKDTRNPIIDVDSDDSVSEIQFVKVALTDKRKVVKYKKCNKINYNKGRCITRRKQRTLYNSSMKVHKFKTSTPRNFNRTLKILRKYCRKKQPTRVWKSFRNESRFNSTVPVNNAKSCNNLEDRPRVQLTLNNLKDTVISRTVSMETNHSLSCDCCKIVYNGKHYRYIDKDQEESLFSEKLVQNNPVVSGTSSQGKCISAGVASPVQRRRLRPIVIDGSNVAITHGKPKNVFSCRGIELCINFFRQRGHHDVTAFVPQYRRSKGWTLSITDQYLLEALGDRQFIVFTPSRKIDDKVVSSYDDRFIIDLATRNGGVIVSNDNFRDIMNEREDWKRTVEERLLMYCFVGDHFMIPSDPLGKDGPHLDDFLSFS